jgi:putative hydrolase of the HAD superfamily
MGNTESLSGQHRTAIQAVIFDYGNVLSRPQASSDLNAMAERCGMPIERFHEFYWKFRPAYDRGELNGTSYWTAVTAEGGKRPTPEDISQLVSLDIQSWLHINQATMTWAVQLRRAGIRLALLSNMPFEIARYIESNCPWVSYFDPLIFSCDLGSVKPELTIYKNCLARLNILPDKVLFLDDRAENVAAAAQLGIPGLVFDDMEKVSREVQRLFDLSLSSEIEASATHK